MHAHPINCFVRLSCRSCTGRPLLLRLGLHERVVANLQNGNGRSDQSARLSSITKWSHITSILLLRTIPAISLHYIVAALRSTAFSRCHAACCGGVCMGCLAARAWTLSLSPSQCHYFGAFTIGSEDAGVVLLAMYGWCVAGVRVRHLRGPPWPMMRQPPRSA